MYKFFINDKLLLISPSKEIPARYQHLMQTDHPGEKGLMDLVRKTEELLQGGIAIVTEEPTETFVALKSHFTTIHAGGGIVFNTEGKLLLMKRMGKWDLPKGKIDPGETIEEGALREVEEECGIKQLDIQRFFENSYHTYKLQGHRFLKITHWYIMETQFTGPLVPQAEESITEVKWIDFENLDLKELDTYESIRDILTELREQKS